MVKVVEFKPRITAAAAALGARKHDGRPSAVSVAVVGLFTALLVMVSVPVWALPTTTGTKVTLTAQPAPAAKVAGATGQELLEITNGPLMLTLEMVRAVAPMLLTITVPGVHVWLM
jgi:hypothetical protein